MGLDINGSVSIDLKGKQAHLAGNVAWVPDPSTLTPVPWAGARGRWSVGQVLCETYWPHDGTPMKACTRWLARQQVTRLQDMGYEIKSGFEQEMQLVDAVSEAPVTDNPGSFQSNSLWNEHEELFFSIDTALEAMGVKSQSLECEVNQSSFEIALAPSMGVKSADDLFILRDAIHQMALQSDKPRKALFMSWASSSSFGIDLHFNHSLCDTNGQPLFYDNTQPDNVSAIARHWTAGLVKHAPALMAMHCPTYNCYRGVHGLLEPHKADWAVNSRHSSFRISNLTPEVTRVEDRLGSGCANPYLVVASTLAAGIDGLKNKLECPPQLDESAVVLPRSLPEALDALLKDDVISEALGPCFVDWFVNLKGKVELQSLGGHHDLADDSAQQIKLEYDYYKTL